jgi:hypothetical protein
MSQTITANDLIIITAGGTETCTILNLKSQYSTPDVLNYLTFTIGCDSIRKTSTLYLKMALDTYDDIYLNGLVAGTNY